MPKIIVTMQKASATGRITTRQPYQKYFKRLLTFCVKFCQKFHTVYLAEGLSQQTDKSESQNNEAEQPFEPQVQFWLSNLIILRGC